MVKQARINQLVDPNSFNPIGQVEGVFAGFGSINGNTVCVFATDGGGIGQRQGQIIAQTIQMATKAGIPIIGLWDSSGILVEEGISGLEGYGQIVQSLTQASGIVPRIMGLLGSSIGTAALIPPLVDYLVAVRGLSKTYCNTPHVTKNLTGEILDVESMANADVQEQILATAHVVTDNESLCFQTIRDLVTYLPSNHLSEAQKVDAMPRIEKFDGQDINDTEQVVRFISDQGSFMPIQYNYGKSMLIGFSRIAGQTIGIVANQSNVNDGLLEIQGVGKAVRFIRFCNAFNIPIVSLVNSQGILPGVSQELGGISKQVAKLVHAYSESTIPKITIISGKALGSSLLAMGSKWVGADLVYAWPKAEIAPANLEAMVSLLYYNQLTSDEDPAKFREEKLDTHREEFATPKGALLKGYIDQVISPEETAIAINNGLYLLQGKRVAKLNRKSSNIPL
ncbi:hypothetical protein BHU72_14405 [Desulfuribacillus stibiiarsenatis]|uniref:CoA carboxyltransferase C-terminal domain-containing protein n=1 Tax=Desulfuribacillus stibiiarsenatis TaxID=1390249 RepID=A0A1E5L7H4_9FIRM|nr:carboxyl transferase domain-containing protein [Desulfuribacillus stibiiarsenatis]OEH86112.1 hypothetical protein BHU72_14405 [Desulfuribacillus stibiiarsenatis]